MKKLICITLSLLIFTFYLTVGVSAEDLKVSFDIYEKSTEKKAVITSSMNTNDLDLFVSAYLESKMVCVKKLDLNLEKGINVINTDMNWDDLEKDSVKLFVWNSSLRPFATYEYAVTRPPVSKLSMFIITGNMEIDYNGNTAYRLSGIHNGKDSRIIVYNPNGYGEENPESLTCDDIVLISEPNGEGVVSYIEKIDAEKTEGIVTQTPMTFVAGASYDPSATSYATIGGDTVIVNNCNVDSYVGRKVDAYIGSNTVYAIVENEGVNTSLTINAALLCDDSTIYWDEENIIAYTTMESSRVRKIELDSNATALINYKIKTNINTTSELATLIPYDGTIEFISNDNDDKIEYMVITSCDEEAVIRSIEGNKDYYTFECYVGNLPRINLADNTKKTIFYKDGKSITPADLAEGDTVSRVKIAENLDIYHASSTKEEGSIIGYSYANDLVVTIAGKDFYVSPFYNFNYDDISSAVGIFYINFCGEIAYYKPDSTAMQSSALITSVYKNLSDNSYYLQTVLADGTVAEYEISKSASIVDENGESILSENTDAQVKAYFNKILTEDGNTGSLDATYRLKIADLCSSTPKNLLVTIHVSSGKISKIDLPCGTNIHCGLNSTYDANSSMIMGKQVDKTQTRVFVVKTPSVADDFVDVNNIKVGRILEYFTDGEYYDNINLYDKNSGSNIYKVLVAIDIEKPVVDISSVFVVKNVRVFALDSKIAYSIEGIQGGREAMLTIFNEHGYGSQNPRDLKKGDVFLIKELSEDGIILEFQKLVSFDIWDPNSSSITVTTGLVNNDRGIFSGFGLLSASNQNGFAIKGKITNDFDSSVVVSKDVNILYESNANYTLVDFYEDAYYPELAVKSASESLFNTSYTTYVYVRYVENEISDVVVYRMG